MARLIGITGLAGSGKSTVAEYLKAKHGYRLEACADALKVIVAYMADEDVSLYHDGKTKEEITNTLSMTRRTALQRVGNAAREALGPDVWIRRLMRDWERRDEPLTVVADIRYDNEAQAILDRGGCVLQVVRPGPALLSGEAAAHVSESGVSPSLITYKIHNDSTLEVLYLKIEGIGGDGLLSRSPDYIYPTNTETIY